MDSKDDKDIHETVWEHYGHYLPMIIVMLLIPVIGMVSMKHTPVKRSLIKWIQYGKRGSHKMTYKLGYIILGIITIQLVNDAMIPTLLGGYIFGPIWGSCLSLVMYGISGLISYYHAKKYKEELEPLIKEHETLATLIHAKGLTSWEWFELVVLSRLPPIYPLHFVSEVWGLTNVNPTIFTVGSLVGCLPFIMILSYMGSRLPHPHHIFSHKSWSLNKNTLMIIIISVILSIIIGYEANHIIKSHN